MNGTASYVAQDVVTVGRVGRYLVYSEQAVKATDPVYLRYRANGAGKAVGQFRKDADTSRAVLLTGVAWAADTTAAGVAVLEVNLP